MAHPKDVALVATGGSISMTLNGGRRSPTLSGTELVTQVADDRRSCIVEVVDAAHIPSSHMGLEDWLTTAEVVRDQAQRGRAVVVSHGTDSLEDLGFLLAQLMPSAPVVLTGAMRPPGSLGADGARNLDDAVVAARGEPPAPCAVFDGEVLPAVALAKLHTTSTRAFGVRFGGRLGVVAEGTLSLEAMPVTRAPMPWPNTASAPSLPPVLQVLPGMPAAQVEAVVETAKDGLVVQSFGGGSLQPAVRARLSEYSLPERLVVTAGPTGPASSDELYPGALDDLRSRGAHIENVLAARQVRIRLALAIAAGEIYRPFSAEAGAPH